MLQESIFNENLKLKIKYEEFFHDINNMILIALNRLFVVKTQ